LFILWLAACSTSAGPREVDAPLAVDAPFVFDDGAISGAPLELAPSLDDILAAELGELPDGPKSELADSPDSDVSVQAVLPDSGGSLAYVRHDPEDADPWQLWLADQTSGARTQVYRGHRSIQAAAVSSDGNTFVLAMAASTAGSDYDVYRLKLDTQSLSRLTNTPAPQSNVSISADGNVVVWEGQRAEGRALFIRVYSGSSFEEGMLVASTDQLQPAVSGNGDHIAFIRELAEENRVMRYSRLNNSYITISKSKSSLAYPSLGNGGDKVAWLEHRPSEDRVRVKTVSTGAIADVASGPRVERPFLTADGKFLTYALKPNENWHIYTKDLTTAQVALAASSSGSVNAYAPYWQKASSQTPVQQAPAVSISAPASYASFAATTTVTFTGAAHDAEDGDLSALISWSSNVQGHVGAGASVSTNLLKQGAHTITASVADSGGLRAQATLTVTVTAPPMNAVPTVAITAPADGADFSATDTIIFSGTAHDAEDGDLSSGISWSSNISGALGTGSRVSVRLSAGTHTITASVADSNGLGSAAQTTVTVTAPPPPPNEAPEVSISAPLDHASFSTSDTVTFTGTAHDAEDGDLSSGISWSSNISGALGTGSSVSTRLSAGAHTITASVTDSGGLKATAQVKITVAETPPVNQAPTVSISAPVNNASYNTTDTITFAGTAHDAEDSDLSSAISWSSSIDGSLGTGGRFSRSLSAGKHTLIASVTDSKGLEAAARRTVTVAEVTTSPPPPPPSSERGVSIQGERWLFNGRVMNRGTAAEGLLLNSRMVSATFDDENPQTRALFARDGVPYDADAQTDRFIAALPSYAAHGLNAVSLNFQGGSTRGEDAVHNSAFRSDGSLKPAYLKRMDRVIRALDEHGMVAILGYFHWRQDQRLANEAAVLNAVDNATDWLLSQGYTNVVVEINNEANIRYDHAVLRTARVHELIKRVQDRSRGKLLVSTSLGGGSMPSQAILDGSDYVLLHGNFVNDAQGLVDLAKRARQRLKTPKPIVYNEDEPSSVERFNAVVSVGTSYGYYDHGGFQEPPTNWAINTPAKRAFFERVRELTSR
jgi:hypothetical protein